MTPVIRVTREAWADPGIPLPEYATDGAAGADLRANFPSVVDRHGQRGQWLAPGERALIPTGLRVEIPAGFEMQIRARSGLALKHGIGLPNAPGTIDADYRGPLGILLINWGETDFLVEHGARIAQAVIAPAPQARFALVDALTESGRGDGGFGSTGSG